MTTTSMQIIKQNKFIRLTLTCPVVLFYFFLSRIECNVEVGIYVSE